ncbi:hypothetical protein [Halorubrum sp. GN12_10-3_MGM]|uniref:hypothetical protein n=1 Tax=Halorubrum sp. GN12_10-3_MGM TaxID=2518113 RepID=UPI0010F4B621|nr:hypothetical protein [Halorubrum sp. GN12_10-3_MGM]TKX63365.1 hypothetical protein EXE47_13720 [Halorubrum sp. GN12_10-3_MGM]
MNRRTIIAGLGSLTASSMLAVGTGAFTSVSAERRLTVETAGDNNALLRLKQLGDGSEVFRARSLEGGSPEQVGFSFPGTGELDENPDLGLGPDSVYEFDRDSGESDDPAPTEGLLRIENQGTQPVEIYSNHETDSELEIELYDVSDADRAALRDDPANLDVGDSVDVGFRIRTFGTDVGTFEETLTIVAERVEE